MQSGDLQRLRHLRNRGKHHPVPDLLSMDQKVACLDSLSPDRLRVLVDKLDVAVVGRSSPEMIRALSEVLFSNVVGSLKVPELRAFCAVLGIDDRGTKRDLIERILATPAGTPIPGLRSPTSTGGPRGLKSALRRFALNASAGFRGSDANARFVWGLLECFGWPRGEAPGVDVPASVSVVEHGQRVTRDVAALWKERRVLVDVVDGAPNSAWQDLLRVCLQLDPMPQFVVLTNQRDLQLYDLSRDRANPRLSIPIDDLPKHSEAFPFFTEGWVPGSTPKIVNSEKVSQEVADLVAKLYRSLRGKFSKSEPEVIRFTLQCIVTMFAEDIGLLPRRHFTNLLYDGARHGDVEGRLRDLFRQMSTRDVPTPRAVAYFNGGLFSDPVTLPLETAELAALTRAAEANWTYVDPHIFGSVFQGIMDDAERHTRGVHYTAHEDIMRVVGPTIVDPWRRRIEAAATLAELLQVRADLFKLRVLDPACGSGNFLYVAFSEIYRLDTEILSRLRKFPSAVGPKGRISWGSGISTLNFFGIDTNRFAVELAKVTLNIAKKIAFEERRRTALDASAQGELEVDPSLPLDNLDKNIMCADALFAEWPAIDAIIGNPPILGDRKIRGELGAEYLRRLQATSGLGGVVDYSCYWFRRAHDRLPVGGRAGLVATSGIRVGKAREATLDYIVKNKGTITNAVSSVVWPGEAALDVSMVSWVKGTEAGPHPLQVDGETFMVSSIPTHLQLHTDVSDAQEIVANGSGTSMGVIFGNDAFVVRRALPLSGWDELRARGVLRPVATGTSMLTGQLSVAPDFAVYLGECETASKAAECGAEAFKYLHEYLRPRVESVADEYPGWLGRWWQPWRPRTDFLGPLKSNTRMIACSNPQARPIYAFLSCEFLPTNTMQIFALDDDYSFGIIQSSAHWMWLVAKGGKVRRDKRYTSEVWTTFPWPQEVLIEAVAKVAAAARALRVTRAALMNANGWSLRELYQAAEVDGPHPLKDAQLALDVAVSEAYGMPPDQDVTEFLLELNRCVVEDETAKREVNGPGLPPGLDPKDKRWFSDDCIQPPARSE